MTWVGTSVRRAEDARLLTGTGRFVDDVHRPGELWLRVVRSYAAHARIAGIDVAAAAALPGTVLVLTGADLETVPTIPIRLAADASRVDGLLEFLQPVLATDRVRYVGEPVAAVVAIDPYAAEDAAELVQVDLEELPLNHASEATSLSVCYGDVDGAFAVAACVVRADLKVGRHGAVPLETRGLVAECEAGRLDVWGATKVPNFNRGVLAEMLGLRVEDIRTHRIDAGGGFGARGEFYPEDFLVPYLARLTGRPVKWIEDRAEHLLASNHSREQLHSIAAAFDDRGRLLALRDEIWHDNGAYLRTHGVAVPELTITMLPGPYRVPAYEGTVHVMLTNKTPCGTYRAPGRYEGTFAREHLFDVAASELGLDRVELRRRNLLTAGEIPHSRPFSTLGADMVLDAGDYPGLLERALACFRYDAWEDEAAALRNEGRLAGTGLGFFLEKSGLGAFDAATVSVDSSGGVLVDSGGAGLGQGLETVMAQIAADELGMRPDRIAVSHTDSDRSPDGTGSWASRTTLLGGNAVRLAAAAAAARARALAAPLLGAAEGELVLVDGAVHVAGEPARRVSLGDLAPIVERGVFESPHMTYPYGVHVALVEVDAGTGAVQVLRYAIAYEIGRAINPKLVEGQLRGGAAQGIAGALLEEFRYDEEGQPLSVSFIDYLLPTALEVPVVETLILEDAPSPDNPLGVKGAGEGGITGCGAAIAGAVRDALGQTGPLPGLPLTPATVHAVAAAR